MSKRELFWIRLAAGLAIAGLLLFIVLNLAGRKAETAPEAPLGSISIPGSRLNPFTSLSNPTSIPSKPPDPVTFAALKSNGSDLSRPLPSFNSCGIGSSTGDTYFTIAAVGDLLLHYNIIDTANRQGYDYLFEKVKPFLQAADLSYANFEGTSNPNAPYSGVFPIFNYDPRLAKAAAKAGIDIVSTANNHAMDSGPAGVDATINSLKAAGLAFHGTVARNTKRELYQPFELKKNGVTIKGSFLSYSWGTNGLPDPNSQVNLLWDANGKLRQNVKDEIAQARRETELVIVAAHWGNEYQFQPTSQQIQAAQEMTAAGADIILGDHPHTLQPVDLIESGNRQALLIYSLGNFIAAQEVYQSASYTQTSLIFYLGVTKQASGKIVLNGYRYLPVYIENNTRPVPIQPSAYQSAYRHVLAEMRDPNGLRAVAANAPITGQPIPVCPEITLPAAAGFPIAGDFAQFFATLGSGDKPGDLGQAQERFGLPVSSVLEEWSKDCSRLNKVLYTTRFRLEYHPEADWPVRITSTLRPENAPLPGSALLCKA